MKCASCGNEFGNGANCQYCGVDRVTGLGNYSGYSPAKNIPQSATYTESHDNTYQGASHVEDKNIICYNCGEIIPADSNFCPYCSRELYVTCPKCGNKYSSQFPACSRCGTNRKKYMDLERIRKMNPFEIPYGTVHIKPYQFQFESNNILYAIIPDTVTSIDDNAFRGCESLREIIIPNSVRLIGKRAFKDCKSLQIIHLPQIKSIEEETFMGCDSLTTIDIPSSVNSIGEYAFANCNSLIEIVIPNTVTSISSHAFDRCTSLASVIMPESFNNIGNWIFECCFNLNPSTKARLRNLEKKYNVKLFYD